MMSRLSRIALVFVALLGAAVLALAVALPRLARRPEVRERLVAEARDATGRELRFDELDVGLLPPRLLVIAPELVAEDAAASVLRAERISLELALFPLLVRTVLVDSLVVEGAELEVRRDADGIHLPISLDRPERKRASSREPRPKDGKKKKEEKEKSGGFQLAVREFQLLNATLRWHDTSVDPPVSLELRDLSLQALTRSLERPVQLEAAAELVGGGRLTAQGEVAPGGSFEGSAALEDLLLDSLAPYLKGVSELSGRADGTLTGRGVGSELAAVSVSLTCRDAQLLRHGLELRGTIPMSGSFERSDERLVGPFELDLSEAMVGYEDLAAKPSGDQASLSGTLSMAPGVFELSDGHLRLRDAEIALRVASAPELLVGLSAPTIGLSGWEAWFPVLASRPLEGELGLRDVTFQPDAGALAGSAEIRSLRIPLEAGHALELQGSLRGEGPALVGEKLALRVADQPLRADLRIEGLSGDGAAVLTLFGEGLDSEAMLEALTGEREKLSGPARIDGKLRAPLAGEAPLLERASGRVAFRVAPGRLEGVSILRSAFAGLDAAGAKLRKDRESSAELEDFYGDAFESLSGTFDVADGVARTEDLRLDYGHHRLDLRGTVGLASRKLDLTGTLHIFKEVDRAIAAEEAGRQPAARVIPLASVTGTIDAPKVVVTPEVALGFAAGYLGDSERRQKLERKLDKKLGEGSGQAVLDIFDALLAPPADQMPPDSEATR